MKRIIAVLAFVLLLSFIVSPLNATESTHRVWGFEWEGFNVDIYAPYQAYPNDIMTITIRVEAREEEVQNVAIRLKIYGSKSQGYQSWYTSFDALDNVDLSWGAVEDQYFNVSIPGDVDSGLVYSETSVSWKVWRESSWQEQSRYGVFRVTYLRNKPYEDLQVAYDQLLADYNALLDSYNALQADYSALQNSYDNLKDAHNELQANYNTLQANYNSLQSSLDSLQNDYNNLQVIYESLNSTYYSLLADYSSLQASFNELKSKYEFGGEIANTLNLTYVFIETTVIFIATTMYYARSQISSALRKLKPKEEKAVDVDHREQQQA